MAISYFGVQTGATSEGFSGYPWYNVSSAGSVLVCPGSGIQHVKELAAKVFVLSGQSGNVRVAIYSTEPDPSLIAQGSAEVSVTGETAAWVGHTSFVDENGDAINPTITGGSSYYLIASADGNVEISSNEIGADCSKFKAGDYTGGFPANLGSGWTLAPASPLVRCGVEPPTSETGTIAVSAAKAVVAISGARGIAPKTGMGALASYPAVVAVSATHAPPEKTGTAAVSTGKAAVASSGHFSATNAGDITAPAATIDLDGAYVPPEKIGTAGVLLGWSEGVFGEALWGSEDGPLTGAPPVVAAAGTFVPPPRTGMVAAIAGAPVVVAAYDPHIVGAVGVVARRAFSWGAGQVTGVLPPPSASGIRVISWLRPAL
jgi:hypothetical protein